MNSIALLSGWRLDKVDNSYYINYTHYIYLKEISKLYDKVYLISPTKSTNKIGSRNIILDILNIDVIVLPYFETYKQGIKYFSSFYKVIKELKEVDLYYCRFPMPYAWMPKLLFRKKCIIDYVGDTVTETLSNKSTGFFKKIFKLALFIAEYTLTLIASKFSKVTTRGEHLVEKLSNYGIKSKAITSSTIQENELYNKNAVFSNNQIKLIFIGYLRYPKGIMILPQVIMNLIKKGFDIKIDIIGDGEVKEELEGLIKEYNLEGIIILHGHIDSRDRVLEYLRESDILLLPSFSEGSPRVVIEAMANSCLVVSTPVGSLPYQFTDGENIKFSNFDDSLSFSENITYLIENREKSYKIQQNAFTEIKDNYLINNFIQRVFTYDA